MQSGNVVHVSAQFFHRGRLALCCIATGGQCHINPAARYIPFFRPSASTLSLRPPHKLKQDSVHALIVIVIVAVASLAIVGLPCREEARVFPNLPFAAEESDAEAMASNQKTQYFPRDTEDLGMPRFL